MKISYFVITVLLIVMKTNICLYAKIDHSLYTSPYTQTSFIEMKSRYKSGTSLKNYSPGTKYQAKVIVHKEPDTINDAPVEFNAELELTKDELRVYFEGKLKKQISYIE